MTFILCMVLWMNMSGKIKYCTENLKMINLLIHSLKEMSTNQFIHCSNVPERRYFANFLAINISIDNCVW